MPLYNQYSQKDITKNGEKLAFSTHNSNPTPSNKFKFIDLFAGIGGIRHAFEKAGGQCVFSCEKDHFAKFTYYSNYGVVPYGDITTLNHDFIPDFDVLCAGFPCQPFSSIGKREGFEHKTQGTMFYEVVKIIQNKKPKVVLLENVKGLTTHENGNTLKTIVQTLKELGYETNYKVLNSYDYGLPQKRERIFIVATKNTKTFEFPLPTKKGCDIGEILESNIEGYGISKNLQQSYLFKKNDGKPTLIDKNSKGPTNTLAASYHKIQRLTGVFVLDGSTGIRTFTATECKRIMGFPDDFIIPVSRLQMHKQMGNSVPVNVVYEIAKNISKILNH